ncbi:MAG: hypothetical protein ACXAEU_25310 [Candidatus Hodarchaeales archaeon]|jgi:hypothetical protein
MVGKKGDSSFQGLVVRTDWYQISRRARILPAVAALIFTFIAFSIPTIYFKSSISTELTFEKSYYVHETAAWLFAIASIPVLLLLLFKGTQPYGLVLSLIALATQLVLYLGFVFLLGQVLSDPAIIAGMGFQVYCIPVGDYWDCTSGMSGHLEAGTFLYMINSLLTFLLVMTYGTEAYLNNRKKAREERT